MLGRSITSTFGGVVCSFGWIDKAIAVVPVDTNTTSNQQYDAPTTTTSFSSYQILPDSSANLNPTIKEISESDLTEIFAMTDDTNSPKGGALWLGEHHNSAIDHTLQADFVRSIHKKRQEKTLGEENNGSNNMSVGLEMVQVQFQQVLDAYIAHKISAKEMKSQVEWETRWSWSFDNYLPIFETCRELNIPLIALNVDKEDLTLVESGGFPNLPRDRLQRYISDPAGFAQFASNPYYKTYVDYVIGPSYDMHQQMGIIGDMSFTSFFSGRILWDEAMASNAYKWNKENPSGLMIGLVGADHVKFQGGITGRYQRMAARLASKEEEEEEANKQVMDCISVILNPTLIDTRPSGSVSMMSNSASAASTLGDNGLSLQLRYLKQGVDVGSTESRESRNTGGVLPLADYIVVSKA